MLKKYFTLLLIGLALNSYGQRVFWANRIIDFSSELSPYEYSAEQVLGKPNALPQGGDNPDAWMPAKPNKLDFITVSFDHEIRVEQIAIAESYNPSAVFEIYLYDENGKKYLVHTFDPRPVDLKGRLLNIYIEKTKYKVSALRLTIDGRKVPGYSGIDAIGISGSNKPIEVVIEQPQNLREKVVVEKLDQNVNSKYDETRPLISPDGKTLYFSRSNDPENAGGTKDPNDIWYSKLDTVTGKWEAAKNIGHSLNNKGENYISSITPDGKAMTVLLGNEYTKHDKMKPGVSISTKNGENWSAPQSLDIINSYIESTDGNYFLANNRKVLIMAIDRYDSFGGKDLYVSFLQEDGRWSEPLNMGNDINTAHTESSPYLAADNETLYFSSKGYSGYGGSDVYISRRLDDSWTNWTEPENLGSDINSDGDDMFFNIPPSGKYAYYSKTSTATRSDIHRIALPIFYQPAPVVSVSGVVKDADSKLPVMAKITYDLLPENTNIGFTMSDSISGTYDILLPAGSAYRYTVDAEGYEPLNQRIDLGNETDFNEIKQDILLNKPASKAVEIAANVEESDDKKLEDFLNHNSKELALSDQIFFDFASDYLKKAAYPYLDKIAQYMKKTPDQQLIIAGHTDNVGSEQYNKSLSKRRAEAVLEYFTSKGLDKSKFEVIGYGSSKPIASNDTMEGRSKNRRVEFSFKE